MISSKKIWSFEIEKAVLNWWKKELATAKTAFLSALIIGFVSNLFVYTGRYYGRDDTLRIYYDVLGVSTGRWIFIDKLAYGYVVPLIYGILVTLFLAIGAFYVCKLFDVRKNFNAVLIGGLLSTFPSIANTNIFLYTTVNLHFAVVFAILAVYLTVRFRFGFIVGGAFTMITLAIYQSKLNIVLALSLFYIVLQLLDDGFKLKDIIRSIVKFASMILIGGISYAMSLLVLSAFDQKIFTGYRGFSVEGMGGKFLSFSEFSKALKSVYKNFYDGFFGNIYFIVKELRYAYVMILVLSVLFLILIAVNKKLYRQWPRLLFAAVLLALAPFACNFANFFDSANVYGLMIYAYVMTLVFAIVLSERCVNIFPVVKSVFTVCMIFVIANYIIGNNVYYLKAHVFNQRTYSLTTRILARIDPLIPLINSNRITFFGLLPNEYYPESSQVFKEYGTINDGSGLGNTSYINYAIQNNFSMTQFAANMDSIHGVRLKPLNYGEKRESIESKVIRQNMPVWPAEGSVGIIDDVIVVNFGLTGVAFEEDETGQYFRAMHYVGGSHGSHKYEYQWQIFENGKLIDKPVTDSDKLYLDKPINADVKYRVSVTVKNTTNKFTYPAVDIKLP